MNSHNQPRVAGFAARVRRSFDAQAVMQTFGAKLITVDPGEVVIELPYQPALTQQNGFVHAGVSATIMDSACGYAAYSLMPEDVGVLTIEFKINLLAPARGKHFRALGRVRKSGRKIFVAEADLFAFESTDKRLVATMSGTLMAVQGTGVPTETNNEPS